MLAEALEHLVRGVVDHPDDVSVRDKQLRRGSILEVRVHPDDLGKVIGRNGRTATAFRTVVSALAGRGGARVDFVDTDRRRQVSTRVRSSLAIAARPTTSLVDRPRGTSGVSRPAVISERVGSVETIEVLVGRIGKPHGIRGEVTVDVRTDEPDRRFAAGSVLRVEAPRGSHSPLRTLTVAAAKWHTSTLLVRFEEIGDRNAAEAARGILLHADIPADAVPDDPDEYYDHQLLGLAAYDLDGR